ncbi:MAG: UDP-N-acetylmuramoyl-L-alanine--D-glutamate ligase [Clostridiaceae bacterium]|jgi:UDP-N-acetylmuramoylalanine--D-glutamate ligase|nr:UDP-N-acetylmuramoyl-L-alanine--D-glutamate ligase [Clostridiaceae bacterium]
MKTSLDQFIRDLTGRRIAVIGAGISNRPLIKWLYQFNRDITVFDMMSDRDPRLGKIRDSMSLQGIEPHWHTGEGYLDKLTGFDLIFRTPKMKLDLPQLIREREQGAVITSEIALFTELCPAPIYGITGSDGKTTTTTLISLMLEEGGHRVFTGGNIGTPLLDKIERISPADRVVLELSSFQLMDMLPLIHRAVITNIIPNHLDFHLDFDEYIEAKKNIFRVQGVLDALILNAKDPVSSAFQRLAKGQLRLFNSAPHDRLTTSGRDQGRLWLKQAGQELEDLLHEEEVILPGAFNLENILAAAAATAGDITPEAVRLVARSFKGVEHRIELVRELDGVRWYNSSVDSSPDRTRKTLEAFSDRKQPLILIAGGQDKNSDYTGLGQAMARAGRRFILTGENAALIEQVLKDESQLAGVNFKDIRVEIVSDLEEAVRKARKLASPDDSVLLSPAGTSYDRYQNFEERGNHFKQLVRDLS